MDAEHRDGTTKPFPRHVHQEQARDGERLFTIAAAIVLKQKEVESNMQTDAECLPGPDLGGARPVVCTGEVVQERGRGADEATRLARAVAGRVPAHLAMAFLAMVGRHCVTAMSRI